MKGLPDINEIPLHYRKLEHMEKFSDDMFNRIVEFQEHLSPAWNTSLPFDQRIVGLPLHALVFSNPDRNPLVYAHTVAAFYPLRAEMRQIAYCAQQVAEHPLVCDIHGRNGFIGSLLGREGVRVVGLADSDCKPNQIEEFFDPACYEPSSATLESVDFPFDVAFSAWMPSGINRTPAIVSHRPKLIVFIHTDHVDTTSGRRQTGTDEAYRDLPAHYQLIAEWSIERPENLLHEVWADLTPSIAETRHVRIFADEPWQDIHVHRELEPVDPYDWEKDLDMALTALEARADLRARGFRA